MDPSAFDALVNGHAQGGTRRSRRQVVVGLLAGLGTALATRPGDRQLGAAPHPRRPNADATRWPGCGTAPPPGRGRT
jgi:hypothetical protein